MFCHHAVLKMLKWTPKEKQIVEQIPLLKASKIQRLIESHCYSLSMQAGRLFLRILYFSHSLFVFWESPIGFLIHFFVVPLFTRVTPSPCFRTWRAPRHVMLHILSAFLFSTFFFLFQGLSSVEILKFENLTYLYLSANSGTVHS